MTDLRGREAAERARHRLMLDEFLSDATRDVERMRALVADLEAGDDTAWERVQNITHNLAVRAMVLKLSILNACARELEQLTNERHNGAPVDRFFMQCVASAIETLALEIGMLKQA